MTKTVKTHSTTLSKIINKALKHRSFIPIQHDMMQLHITYPDLDPLFKLSFTLYADASLTFKQRMSLFIANCREMGYTIDIEPSTIQATHATFDDFGVSNILILANEYPLHVFSTDYAEALTAYISGNYISLTTSTRRGYVTRKEDYPPLIVKTSRSHYDATHVIFHSNRRSTRYCIAEYIRIYPHDTEPSTEDSTL